MSECDDKDYDDRDSDEHEPSLPPMLADDTVSVDSSGHKVYKYRDFGDLEDANEEDVAGRVPTSATAPSTRGSGESSIRVQKFPVKLYAILAQKEFHEIISWMPHGRAWKVLKPSMFESLVMPLFFEYSNYHSFNRLVNAWSFRRVSSGPDRGAYYHELFLRGKPNLHKYMRRLPKMHKKLPMKKGEEPDFYKLDKAHPLPTLEEVPVTNLSASMMVAKHQHHQHQQHSMAPGDMSSALSHHQHQQQLMDQRIVTPPRPAPMHLPMQGSAPMAPSMMNPNRANSGPGSGNGNGGGAAPQGMSPHGRPYPPPPPPPQSMYSLGQPLDMQGGIGYDEYEMVPMPPMQATSGGGGPRGPMSHQMAQQQQQQQQQSSLSHPGAPTARASAVQGYLRPPLNPAPGGQMRHPGMAGMEQYPQYSQQPQQQQQHQQAYPMAAMMGGGGGPQQQQQMQQQMHPQQAQYMDPNEYFLYQQQQQMQHMQQVHHMRMYERQQQVLHDDYASSGGGGGVGGGGGAVGAGGGGGAAGGGGYPSMAAGAAAAAQPRY